MLKSEIERKIDNLHARLDDIEEYGGTLEEKSRIHDMISRLYMLTPSDEFIPNCDGSEWRRNDS